MCQIASQDRGRHFGALLQGLFIAVVLSVPGLAAAQASPFMTGATALQTNILAWLTPVAIILIMVLGAMAMANRIVENCGNTLIFRCSASENGGTSRFASNLIGDREVERRQVTRGRDSDGLWSGRSSRSTNTTSQRITEAALLPSEIEQLPDLAGYLKLASRPEWRRVALQRPRE